MARRSNGRIEAHHERRLVELVVQRERLPAAHSRVSTNRLYADVSEPMEAAGGRDESCPSRNTRFCSKIHHPPPTRRPANASPRAHRSGPRPARCAVEKIKMGDRVFACDAETGCLAAKVVLAANRASAHATLQDSPRRGGNPLQTGGHCFWVSGRGWIMGPRDLEVGMNVHIDPRHGHGR